MAFTARIGHFTCSGLVITSPSDSSLPVPEVVGITTRFSARFMGRAGSAYSIMPPSLQRSRLMPLAVSMLLPPPTATTAPYPPRLQKAAPSFTRALGGSACTRSNTANSTPAVCRLAVTWSAMPARFIPSSHTTSAL